MPSENKRIRNATEVEYNGLTLKSQLEKTFYKVLVESGFEPKYEEMKFIVWEGFKPTVPFYNRNKKKELVLEASKIRSITYTPDFTFMYNGILVIIEAKGIENDVFPIKKKLFRKHIETLENCLYFELHTRKELLQAISIIKNYQPINKEKKAELT